MATPICPGCGNQIEPDDPGGLCPLCLVKQGERTEPEGDALRRALEEKLGTQYRLIRLLGRGGMGTVYLARDLSLDREVAIKVISTASDERSTHERFRREARTAARLSHPNIVPLYAFGEVERMPYFVMGYVRGETLAERLRRDGRIPEDEARRILGEIADGLDHAHRQGIVHRDVKPDNVLLDDETGRALLTDFGVAKGTGKGETLTAHGSVVGTPHYMSPEQAAGRIDIDGRSDIYSLGVMAYAMLAGRVPFDGSSAAAVLTKQITQEPAPLASLAPAVSDATVQTVQRCLAKDPAARWQDARSLKLALGLTEEAQLPDALHAVESKGLLGLAATAAVMLFYLVLAPGNELLVFIEGVFAGLFLFVYAFASRRVRREGFSSGEVHRALWREPAWWLWWYPRPLRRQRNVWARLPGSVRAVRWSVFAFVAFVAAGYLDIAISSALFKTEHGEPRLFISGRLDAVSTQVGLAMLGVIVGSWLFFTFRSRKILTQAGLAPSDVNRIMLTVPPSRVSFWSRPHVAAILAPAPSDTKIRLDSPHDWLQAIRRDADELSGPLRPLAAEAAVAARQLVDSIEDSERHIADLARSLEPGEEERLRDRIEALAGVEEYASMRLLLEKQLQLVQEMSARIDVARESRNRHVEMLKTLSLHVASLRARLAQSPSEVHQLTDKVRALCDEISVQAQPGGRGNAGVDLPTVERTRPAGS